MGKNVKSKNYIMAITALSVICMIVIIATAWLPRIISAKNSGQKSSNYTEAKAVYLAPASGGVLGERALKAHHEIVEVHSYKALESCLKKHIVSVWVDKNAVDILPDNWIDYEPQKYYPIILVGVGNSAEMSVKLNLPVIGIPYPAFKNRNANGFSVWLLKDITNSSLSSFWRGYSESIDINKLLKISNNLLEKCLSTVQYKNTQYGFSFNLPLSWKNYKIIESRWSGEALKNNIKVPLSGPLITIRHPLWSKQNQRQDIPILILTVKQWTALQNKEFHIGAVPLNPIQIGQNNTYVFAFSPRYGCTQLPGTEEVHAILERNPLKAFRISKGGNR